MTARSKKQQNRNARIKREKNKVKELARLRKTVGWQPPMETDQVTVVEKSDIDKKKEKQEEALIKEEFIEEKVQQDRGQTITVVNQNSKKRHHFNTKTMKDQFGNYPAWYRANKVKRKINKRKVSHKSNFWTRNFVPL